MPVNSPGKNEHDVDAFLASLNHPFKNEIEELRKTILGADRRITEGIKWNAPSFRTTEWFATFHLRAKEGVQVILHLGAKKKDNSETVKIDDPDGLLEWLSSDRASAKFRDAKDVKSKKAAFGRVIRQWVQHV